MKNSLILSFLLASAFIYGQSSEPVTLNWKKSTDAPFSSFEGMVHAEADFQTPAYCDVMRLEQGLQKASIQIEVLSSRAVEAGEAALLAEQPIGNTIKVEVNTSRHKGVDYTGYCFYPFIRKNGRIERVVSFRVRSSQIPGAERIAKTSATTFTQNSVLASGTWFKLAVNKTGLHKITPNFMSELGVSNPLIADVKLVGNGTGMLPEFNGTDRPDDLEEVPFKAFDQNNDGTFNGNDFVVFYAKGPHEWQFNASDSTFSHIQNIYRDVNYYFISADAGPGAQIGQRAPLSQPASLSFSTYDDYQFIEDEKQNLVGTGRVWVGDVFDFTRSRNYSFAFTDVDQTVPARIRVNIVARASTGSTLMETNYNGVQILTNPITPYPTVFQYNDYVTRSDRSVRFTPVSPNNITINLNYNNSANPTGVAWLDFIELQLRRELTFRNTPLYFRNALGTSPAAVAEYTITNANGAVDVWDVTEHNNPQQLPTEVLSGSIRVKVAHDQMRELVAFSGSSNLPEPESRGVVANQNLHALQDIDMLIVSHRNFLDASNALADFHRNSQNFVVEVVDVEQVYNEFSSGGQDISAIRDFARMLYERSNAGSGRFKYLLLMGDASYDYKNRITGNDNYVPIYESANSFNLGTSSITDDFYALLDPTEGDRFTGAFLDIGVGRVPARSTAQANAYVEKVKAYAMAQTRFGDWRNRVLLIADDMDLDWEDDFVFGSEGLANRTRNASPAFNVDKIYADAYKQVSTTGRQTYPEANRDIFRKVQQGNLITNYIGHGGEIGLSSEGLITLNDVNSWTNLESLPLFITITCEFTRVDDPTRVSAGEQLITNRQGGAIGSISTTRVVGASPAINLNRSIFDTLLARPNNMPLTLGDIIVASKNRQVSNPDKLKFSLFGDPALRLAIPFYDVQTNTVNGIDINNPNQDTLKARSKVTISGQVNDFNGNKISDFNGILDVSVFDKPSQRKTLKNDVQAKELDFTVQNNLIYKGKVSVSSGDFEFQFIVPQDISFRYGNGKISYYANNGTVDAAGAYDSVLVGGFDGSNTTDKTGPEVALFMNDESFVRGGITGRDPELYALISDSSGVNTVGTSVGHDLVAVLDGKTDQSYVLNEYYEADLDSYQSGRVRYPFFDLETGEHQLQLKVFDVFNNFSIAETDFIVAEDEELVLRQVLNYPNPFTTYTEFQFEHNRANQPLQVQVQVFTVSGQLVKTINTALTPTGNRVTGIAWDGLDDYGDKIGKGVYVYRVKVNAPTDNSSAEEYEKLVILR